MNKYTIAFLLTLIPALSHARAFYDGAGRDRCTNPDAYTIDRRCYVTDAQKTLKPYNAVVALVNDIDLTYCTGTLIHDGDKILLYTAKHCVVNVYDNKDFVKDTIELRLQDGTTASAVPQDLGNYIKSTDENYSGDWAIHWVMGATENMPYVNLTDGLGLNWSVDARLVGYGALKIMSDAEIDDFKYRYLDYLTNTKNIPFSEQEEDYGVQKDGGIWTLNLIVEDFIYKILPYAYRKDIFYNSELKESVCSYSRGGSYTDCQSWGGNSGGGVFDNDGNLMAIHTRGIRIIGGDNHAEAFYGKSQQPRIWNEFIDKVLK